MVLTKEETVKAFKIMLSLIDKGMFSWSELKGVHETMEKMNENIKDDKFDLDLNQINFVLNSIKVCSNRKPIDIDEQIQLEFNGVFYRLKELKTEVEAASEKTSVTEL